MDITYKTNSVMKSHLETITQTLNSCSDNSIKASFEKNRIILVQVFNKGKRDEVSIVTDFNFDMDSLLSILKKRDLTVGESIILNFFEDEDLFKKIFPLVLENNYNEISNIVINNRGIGVASNYGII